MTSKEMLQPAIKKALDSAKERVEERDKDFVCPVTGEEGDGKSALSILMADYVDPDFDVSKQVCMDHEDFIKTADELDKYQAIVFDEGIEALLSRNHGKSKNKMMIEWFREVRAKNLFIFVNMPEFKEIEKPIRDDRAHVLVRIVKQGWAHFFSKTCMDEITVDRRGNRVRAKYPDPSFRAGWKDPADLDLWKDYQEMKTENVHNLSDKYLGDGDEDSGPDYEDKYRKLRKKIAKTFVRHLDMSQNSAADKVGVSSAAYAQWKKRGNLTNVPPFDIKEDVESLTNE